MLNRGRRMDMLIAAVALANGCAVVTRNAQDFAGLEKVVDVIAWQEPTIR
jgi:predicted nucleic acid-binding protein